jgi:hypothetical protein
MTDADSKKRGLAELARRRKADRLNGYANIADFDGGIYDQGDFVSPYTRGAGAVDSPIMIVLQDWASEDYLKAISEPVKKQALEYGRALNLRTNTNLERLLELAFKLGLKDVYATNLFVFVKRGGMSTNIPKKDLVFCAKTYTIREIEIVKPRIVICVGAVTYNALVAAVAAIGKDWQGPPIVQVTHTGALGERSAGGFSGLRKQWDALASHYMGDVA